MEESVALNCFVLQFTEMWRVKLKGDVTAGLESKSLPEEESLPVSICFPSTAVRWR